MITKKNILHSNAINVARSFLLAPRRNKNIEMVAGQINLEDLTKLNIVRSAVWSREKGIGVINMQEQLIQLEKEFSYYNDQLNNLVERSRLNKVSLFVKLDKNESLKNELIMIIATQNQLKLPNEFFLIVQKMYQITIGNFPNVIVREKEPIALEGIKIANSSIEWSVHKSFRGKGRCWICSRELTNQESIERGIGPICFGRYGGFSPLSQEEKKLSGWVDANFILSNKKGSEVSDYIVLKETDKGILIQVNFENGVSFQKWSAKRNMVYYNETLFVKSNFAGLSFIR